MTSLPPPDAERLAALGRHFRFGLTPAELAEYAPAVEATLASPAAVEALYARAARGAPAPRRDWA
ncbi:MAG: amidase, partial [Rhodococcus sp. (in: high G+C Gram-positive bacteria)]